DLDLPRQVVFVHGAELVQRLEDGLRGPALVRGGHVRRGLQGGEDAVPVRLVARPAEVVEAIEEGEHRRAGGVERRLRGVRGWSVGRGGGGVVGLGLGRGRRGGRERG